MAFLIHYLAFLEANQRTFYVVQRVNRRRGHIRRASRRGPCACPHGGVPPGDMARACKGIGNLRLVYSNDVIKFPGR